MFRGYIGRNGVGKLVLCTRTVNALYYREIHQNSLIQSKESMSGCSGTLFTFQQNNESRHTARYKRIFLVLRGIKRLPWPSQFPNINIIENVWLFLKRKLYSNPPKTKEELIVTVFEELQAIPKQYTDKFYQSIPRRVETVLRQRDYPTKY